MLKQRILTAAIVIPLLVAALFYLPLGWLTVLFGLFIGAAAWEWASLAGLQRFFARLIYVACVLLLGAVLIYTILREPSPTLSFFAAAVLWWLWALVELVSRKDVKKGMFATPAGRVVGGFLVLVPLWVGAVYLLAADI